MESRAVPTATPVVSFLNLQPDPFLGEDTSFTLRFDNTASGSDVGYGPFVDLFLPTTGVDGAGIADDDGISFLNATFLGAPVTATEITLLDAGVEHPYAVDTFGDSIIITPPPDFQEGDTLVVLQLPFGSFTPDQPAADITVNIHVSDEADIGAANALPMSARGGFQFGETPLDDPATDPTLIGSSFDVTAEPTLLRLTKEYIGPENETATGPNFTRQYRVTVDIADGQTITSLDLTDVLPNNLQFVSVDSTNIRGTETATTALSTPSTSTPGGTLTRRFSSVQGTSAANDAVMDFSFYVPLNDASGNPVINATSGDDVISNNDARTAGTWDPIDDRDNIMLATSDAQPIDHVLTDKSIAIQKNVTIGADTGAPGPSPGDTLQYTLTFQVSDYFAFQNIFATDTFSDGQLFDDGFTPTLTITEHGSTLAVAPFDVDHFTVSENFTGATGTPNPPFEIDPAPNDGTTTVTFRISDEMGERSADGKLIGGAIPDAGTGGPPPQSAPPLLFGGTTGTIVFQTMIQDSFFDPPTGVDASVDQGDVLDNDVTIVGDLLQVGDVTTVTGQNEADTSSAGVTIVRGELDKVIYAINGVIAPDPDAGYANRIIVHPGDDVTYRLTYSLPTSDVENLRLTDYLPLPVFDATSISTVFVDTISAAAPASGQAKFGPDETFRTLSGIVPSISTDGDANSVQFDIGTYDNTGHPSSEIDILFTVTVSDDPFADGLFLTNQVREEDDNSFGVGALEDSIIQITLAEPDVTIHKGVVGFNSDGFTLGGIVFDAPNVTPPDFTGTIDDQSEAIAIGASDVADLDADDVVRFALVAQNTGGSDAFDLIVRDNIPTGFVAPLSETTFASDVNLTVRHGDGTLLSNGQRVDSFVRVATTVDLGASFAVGSFTNAPTVIDGVALADGDRVLVKDQTNSEENGIYLVTDAANGSWTRVSDFDESSEMTAGYAVTVLGGSTHANNFFTLDASVLVVDASPVSWTQGAGNPDYYFVYDPASREFEIIAADRYDTGINIYTGTLNQANDDSGNPLADGSNTLVVLYDVTLESPPSSDAVQPNQQIQNTVTLSNYGSADGAPDHTIQDATETATVTIANVDPTKSIVATSESHTVAFGGTERATIGEIVRYRLQVELPEGFVSNFQVQDLLPAGLTYLDDGTARLALVSNNVPIASTTPILLPPDTPLALGLGAGIFGTGPWVQGDETTIDSITPTFVLPDQNVGSDDSITTDTDNFNTGADPFFKLGDLANADDDDNTEYVVIEFNALVDNTVTGDNDRGNLRTNSFDVFIDSANLASSNNVNIRIAEPNFTLTKSADSSNVDAGDTVTFTVTYTNGTANNDSTAFETRLIDSLPSFVTLVLGSVTINPGSATGVTNNSAGNVIDITIDEIPKGASVEVSYAVTVNANVLPGQEITNTVTIGYTSLSGDFGTTSNPTGSSVTGAPGSDTGERTDSGVAPNDNFATTNETITVVTPVLDKTVVETSETFTTGTNVAIGEIVRYRLQTRVPESNALDNFQLIDQLPDGLTFLDDNTATVLFVSNTGGITSSTLSGLGLAASGNESNVDSLTPTFVLPSGAISVSPFGTGDDVTFSLGDIDNDDADADFEFIVVEFNVLVDNTATGDNDAGETRDNTYQVHINGNQSGVTSDAVTVTIVEPNLTIEKQVTATDGTTVTYEVIVTNDGTSTAHDNRIFDMLPASLSLNTASVTVQLAGSASGDSDVSSGNDLDVLVTTIPVDGVVTITYTVDVVTTGILITNTAQVDYTSLPGTGTTGNPTGSDTPGGTNDDDGERLSTANDNAAIGSLGDLVWVDANGNTIADPGEPGIPNVDVQIRWAGPDGTFDNGDDSVFTVTTDGDGLYLANGLPIGEAFRVTVLTGTLPNGLTNQTHDRDGLATPNQATLSLTAGNPNPRDVDFGYRGTSALGDFVWNDQNGDGVQDAGEPGIPTVTVDLTWLGFDGAAGGGDDVSYSAVTDANGDYGFANLPAGNFIVDVDGTTVPANVTLTTPPDPRNVTLGIGETNNTIDFGFQGDSGIGDFVWNDQNGDGIQDAGEPGIPGVTVDLTWAGPDGILGNGDDVSYSTVTDANGDYIFAGLPEGLYEIDADQSTAPANTTLTTGNDPHQVNLAANTDYEAGDFGFQGDSSIGDFVWNDQNGDGVQDAGEPGIPGVTVDLTWAGPDGILGNGDDVSYTTVTDANGDYTFAGIPEGLYEIDVDQSTAPANTTLTTGNDPHQVNLAANTDYVAGDFGFQGDSSIGDFVWNDQDGDGVQDAGEPGIPGVTVDLTWAGPDGILGNGDDVSYSTVTDANGDYIFAGLPEGLYEIDVDQSTAPANTTLTTGNDPHQVNLAANTDYVAGDFGFQGDSSIGDFVWNDQDGDGIQDAGEPGIPSVTVNLIWAGPDGILNNGDDVNYTTVTDANGDYSFIGLPEGLYEIDVDQSTAPANTTLTTGNDPHQVNLAANTDYIAGDFGFQGDSSIGDFVWNDQNGDGVQDAGEPGIPSVTVNLTWAGLDGILGNGDDVSYSTVTDANGDYTFAGIPEGLYEIDVDQSTAPANTTLTTGNDPHQVNLAATTDYVAGDFGFQGDSSIGDFVWNDQNGDGVQDAGEPGIPSVTVNLTWAGPDGILGNGDDVFYSTTTNADGEYSFTGIPEGLFEIDIDDSTIPANLILTTANDPLQVNLSGNQDFEDGDFGYQGDGELGDRVWFDFTDDGAQDTGEPGIVGATVLVEWAGPDGALDTSDDVTYGPLTTGANGIYGLSGLPLGVYRVTVTGGLSASLDTPTFDLDSGTTNPDETATITITDEQLVHDNVDFGYRGTGTIGDRVWNDRDGDQQQEAGEPGIPGVTMTLTWFGVDGAAGGGDDVVIITETGADGFYQFNNLPAGNFMVDVGFVPNNLTLTTPPDPASVTLGDGEMNDAVDFGYQGNAAIGNLVWYDVNADGTQNLDEPGLADVPIEVRWFGLDGIENTQDDVLYNTTTDANGFWQIGNLPAGSYRATVDPTDLIADGFSVRTFDFDGEQSPDTSLFALNPGQQRDDIDFGYRGTGSIGDAVWFDLNANGLFDENEDGFANVTVNLLDGNGNLLATTINNADGTYLFDGIAPGTYALQFAAPGFVFTFQDRGTDDAIDSDVGMFSGRTENFDLANGENDDTRDAGILPFSSLAGRVFRDYEANGLFEPSKGETGIGGVTITLTGVAVTGDSVFRQTTTDFSGRYLFDELLPGNYSIRESQPSGFYYDGIDRAGSLGGVVRNDRIDVAVAPNVDGVGYNFGENPPADPFGYVFVDVNQNGIRDLGEPGIPGVTVVISGTAFAGTPLARPLTAAEVPGGLTRVTDQNGYYQFAIVPPGIYNLVEIQPPGFIDGLEQNGDTNPPFEVVVGNDIFAGILHNAFPIRGPFNFGEFLPGDEASKLRFLASTAASGANAIQFGLTSDPASVSSAPQFTVNTGNPNVPTYIAVGSNPGSSPMVHVYNYATGGEQFRLQPFSSNFHGGVNTAVGDITGDGVDDIIVAARFGGGPHVRVFDGVTGNAVRDFFAYHSGFQGGISLASGDVNGDGFDDIITGAGPGGGPHVQVFSGRDNSILRSFMVYAPSFAGGIHVASGDVDADGFDDIITGAGSGGGPHVRAFSGTNLAILADFFAYASTFSNGVNVGVGDIDGDGRLEVLTGAGPIGGPHVRAYDVQRGVFERDFMAFDPHFTGGVRVNGVDVNGDGVDDLVLTTDRGVSHVRILDGVTHVELEDFFANHGF